MQFQSWSWYELGCALRSGIRQTIDFLKTYSINPLTFRTVHGESFMEYALHSADITLDVLDFLFVHYGLPLSPSYHSSVRKLKHAKYLVEQRGILPDHTTSNNSPLVWAAAQDVSLVEYYLDLGLNLDTEHTFQGKRALHKARTVEMFQFLLNRGANPNVVNDFGETPLMYHLQSCTIKETLERDIQIIEMLIVAGTNLNQRNIEGMTALDIAFFHKVLPEFMILLLIHGGELVHFRGFEAKTFRYMRDPKEYQEVKDLMRRMGYNIPIEEYELENMVEIMRIT